MSEPAPAVTAGRSPRVYTASGFVAIAIWGLSPAVLRLVGESLGLFTTGAVVNLSAGVLGLIVMRVITGHWPAWRDLRSARFIQGGVLFVLYTVTQFAATILAHTREEVVVVTGIKFLWPLVTLLISIAVLKHRWGRMLVLGVALSAAGTYSMVLGDVAVGDILSVLDSWSAMLPLLLALASCTAWGCYSVLLAVHEGRKSGGADLVGPWMLLSGIVMGVGALLLGESSVWRVSLVWELAFQIILVSFLATWCWNLAIRKGDSALVIVLSNLLPLLAVVGAALLLGVGLTPPVVIGAGLVVAGTIISRRSVHPAPRGAEHADDR